MEDLKRRIDDIENRLSYLESKALTWREVITVLGGGFIVFLIIHFILKLFGW